MKIYRKQGLIIWESVLLVKCFGYLAAGTEGYKKAKAAALWPIIFLRSNKEYSSLLIRHEQIHFRQQLELLFFGFWFVSVMETIFFKFVKRISSEEVYLFRSCEQEAYLNQHDEFYLERRKPFAMFKYFLNKKNIVFVPGREPEVIISDYK